MSSERQGVGGRVSCQEVRRVQEEGHGFGSEDATGDLELDS